MTDKDYNTLTVAQIRALFKSRGIPATGLTRKQQLIEKLEEVDAQAQENDEPVRDEDHKEDEAQEPSIADQTGSTEATEPVVEEKELVKPASEEPSALAQDPAADLEAPKSPKTEPVKEKEPAENLEKTSGAFVQPSVDSTPPQAAKTVEPEEPSAKVELAEQAATPPSEESRKRKRRSDTPPVDPEEAAKKRARQEEASVPQVHLKEDGHRQERDQTVATTELARSTGKDPESARDQASNEASPGQEPPKQEPVSKDARFRHLNNEVTPPDSAISASEESGVDVPPALYHETAAIYIRNLKRPIRAESLETHLLRISGTDSESLQTFFIDRNKTHAFARFSTKQAASRARSLLHNRVWPTEPQRERLWVDFVPEDHLQSWIDAENGVGRGDMKRWEVSYESDDGAMVARHQEVGAAARPAAPTRGDGAPRLPPADVRRESEDRREDRPASFLRLDELFRSTTAKPKLYYLPVDRALAERRLDELDTLTSRRMRGRLPPGGSGLRDSRRYTFEDRDLLVDGGPEFGLRRNAPLGPPRGRGRGWR